MGDRAISIAARQNRDKILRKLLNYSETKVDDRNQAGGTVLHMAAAGMCFIFFLFCILTSFTLLKAMVDSPECVQLLIGAGLDVNSQDQKGNTPSMIACFFNKPRILRALIAANADLSIKNVEEKDAAAICDERAMDECKEVLQQK